MKRNFSSVFTLFLTFIICQMTAIQIYADESESAQMQSEDVAPGFLLPPPRDPNGKIKVFNQIQAQAYCASFGSRLPSLDEVINLGRTGQRQNRNTAFPGQIIPTETEAIHRYSGPWPAILDEIDQMHKEGYQPRKSFTSSGREMIDYYYDYTGGPLSESDKELTKYWYWTSSVVSVDSDRAFMIGLQGSGLTGFRDRDYGGQTSVRCVRKSLD